MNDALQRATGEWAEATFPHSTPESIVAHLRREVEELATAVAEREGIIWEASDCALLLLHLAHKRGFSLDEAARSKLETNRLRTWGRPDAEGVVEHVR